MPVIWIPGANSSAHVFDDIAPEFVASVRQLGLTPRGQLPSSAPDERMQFDYAIGMRWERLHANSLDDAVRRVRAGRVHALFIDASIGHTATVTQVAAIVKECVTIPVIAVVTE